MFTPPNYFSIPTPSPQFQVPRNIPNDRYSILKTLVIFHNQSYFEYSIAHQKTRTSMIFKDIHQFKHFKTNDNSINLVCSCNFRCC